MEILFSLVYFHCCVSKISGVYYFMEIERKFTIKELPADLDSHTCLLIEQAYLNTDPVIRIRRQDDDYYLTYKGKASWQEKNTTFP